MSRIYPALRDGDTVRIYLGGGEIGPMQGKVARSRPKGKTQRRTTAILVDWESGTRSLHARCQLIQWRPA